MVPWELFTFFLTEPNLGGFSVIASDSRDQSCFCWLLDLHKKQNKICIFLQAN